MIEKPAILTFCSTTMPLYECCFVLFWKVSVELVWSKRKQMADVYITESDVDIILS